MRNVHCKILGEWCQYLPLNFLATKKKEKQSWHTLHASVRLDKPVVQRKKSLINW